MRFAVLLFLGRSTEGYWDQRGAKGGCHTCCCCSVSSSPGLVVVVVVVVLRLDSYLSSLADSGSAAAVCVVGVVVLVVVVSTPSWASAPAPVACCERSTCRRRSPTCLSRKAAAVGARTLSFVVVVAAEASLASRCGR